MYLKESTYVFNKFLVFMVFARLGLNIEIDKGQICDSKRYPRRCFSQEQYVELLSSILAENSCFDWDKKMNFEF